MFLLFVTAEGDYLGCRCGAGGEWSRRCSSCCALLLQKGVVLLTLCALPCWWSGLGVSAECLAGRSVFWAVIFGGRCAV